MTPSEYKELVDFLGRKFDRVDRRFDQVEQRLQRLEDRMSGVEGRQTGAEDRLIGVEVLAEKNHTDIQLLAESLKLHIERMDAFHAEVRQEFSELRTEMKAGFGAIHARVDRLEAA
jgi:predicted  nucleic acid-binding Zn-ribbon protein